MTEVFSLKLIISHSVIEHIVIYFPQPTVLPVAIPHPTVEVDWVVGSSLAQDLKEPS
jgi:hypothetical protein